MTSSSTNTRKECKCGCHTEKYIKAPLDIKMKPIGCEHCQPSQQTKEIEKLNGVYKTISINEGFKKCIVTPAEATVDISNKVNELIDEVADLRRIINTLKP